MQHFLQRGGNNGLGMTIHDEFTSYDIAHQLTSLKVRVKLCCFIQFY